MANTILEGQKNRGRLSAKIIPVFQDVPVPGLPAGSGRGKPVSITLWHPAKYQISKFWYLFTAQSFSFLPEC